MALVGIAALVVALGGSIAVGVVWRGHGEVVTRDIGDADILVTVSTGHGIFSTIPPPGEEPAPVITLAAWSDGSAIIAPMPTIHGEPCYTEIRESLTRVESRWFGRVALRQSIPRAPISLRQSLDAR